MRWIFFCSFLCACSLFREDDSIEFKGKATEELLNELHKGAPK